MAGVGVGLVGSVIVSRAMAGLLVGVSPTDPLTLVLATVLLTAVALAGCFLPTRRAVRVDPIAALRT
jgi:putative ABC transport system permease protein